MDIALLYFDGCPSWRLADQRLRAVTAGRPDITLTHHRVETAAEADRVGFRGSPSILIDGIDPFASADTDADVGVRVAVGLSCRLYETPDGPAGAPSLDQLRAAIADA